jgi:hypothetical protein
VYASRRNSDRTLDRPFLRCRRPIPKPRSAACASAAMRRCRHSGRRNRRSDRPNDDTSSRERGAADVRRVGASLRPSPLRRRPCRTRAIASCLFVWRMVCASSRERGGVGTVLVLGHPSDFCLFGVRLVSMCHNTKARQGGTVMATFGWCVAFVRSVGCLRFFFP